MQFVPSDSRRQSAVNNLVSGHYALMLSGLFKSFRDVKAVSNLDLRLAPGEIVCLLGPSGCGKTTTLRLIAGFDTPDAGTIHVENRLVAGPGVNEAPERRRVGMVFQEGALFPHLSVAQNIAFGLKKGRQRTSRVAEALRMVNLEGYDGRFPHQLSGGQQQRVARALAPAPDLILMDEPFSSLDAGLRGQLRAEVRAILKERGATVVCVTHDQEEAMQLADRVAVMNQGASSRWGLRSGFSTIRTPGSLRSSSAPQTFCRPGGKGITWPARWDAYPAHRHGPCVGRSTKTCRSWYGQTACRSTTTSQETVWSHSGTSWVHSISIQCNWTRGVWSR